MSDTPKGWVTLVAWVIFLGSLFALGHFISKKKEEPIPIAPSYQPETRYQENYQWTAPKEDNFSARVDELRRQLQELIDQRDSDRMMEEWKRMEERWREENERELDRLMEKNHKRR